jgi:ComF family protein
MFDIFFPTYCINCSHPGEYLCSDCLKKLKCTLPECYICRKISNGYTTHKNCNQFGIENFFVGWEYNEIAKKILAQYKFRYAYKLSLILSKILIDRLNSTRFSKNITSDTLLIPMPIHKDHQNERGFNQTQLIASTLAQHFNCKLEDNLIKRVGDNNYQSQQSVSDRLLLENDVFEFCKDKNPIGKNIILIDDVISTGTTINRAAQILKRNNLSAIALFRGKPHYQYLRE